MKFVRILALRPNNWYINLEKLERVRAAWGKSEQDELPPVLVTKINNELSLIDGHSRAFAAFERGETHIKADICKLESIEGSTALYKHIHIEGPNIGIQTIADLAGRILSREEHKRLWTGYCNNWLEKNENAPEN